MVEWHSRRHVSSTETPCGPGTGCHLTDRPDAPWYRRRRSDFFLSARLRSRTVHLGIHAAATPDKPAYIMAATGETITYRQLEEDSSRIAHLMRSAGINPG